MTEEDWKAFVEGSNARAGAAGKGIQGQIDKEVEMVKLLKWFDRKYSTRGVDLKEFCTFFPATATGLTLSQLVFRW